MRATTAAGAFDIGIYRLARTGLSAGVLFAAACGVAAADDMTWQRAVDGLYVEGRLIAPLTQSFDGSGTSSVPAANGDAELEFNSGYSFAFALGTRIMPKIRAEAELHYTKAKDAKVDFRTGFVGNAFQGLKLNSRGTATLMLIGVNAFYDVAKFDIGGSGVVPFVGAGIGAMRVEVDNMAPDGARFVFDDTDTVVAGSLHAGVDVAVADRVTATLRYTAAVVDDLSFAGTDTFNAGGVATAHVDSHVEHFIGIGLRYSFR